MLFVGLSLLCGLVGANPNHSSVTLGVKTDGNKTPTLPVLINSSGMGSDAWYQIHWKVKSFNKDIKQDIVNSLKLGTPDHEFRGELDMNEVLVTSIDFLKWPPEKDRSYYYECTCQFVDYDGDDPEGTTAEEPSLDENFAEVNVHLQCSWDIAKGTPKVTISSDGTYDKDKVDSFDVTLSDEEGTENIKSISVDIGKVLPPEVVSNK